MEGHQLGVVSVDISHNGAIAASSSLDAHIRLWDLETGKQIKSMDAGPGDSVILYVGDCVCIKLTYLRCECVCVYRHACMQMCMYAHHR